MSNTKELKNYLLEKEKGKPFLLDETNNGKTIMLSGAWGAGKTHFWKKEIEPELSENLKAKEKACVYVSLYGKENIETLKNEILFKAYESIKEENGLKKRAISAFGGASRALSFSAFGFKLSTKELSEKLEAYDEEKKIEEAESFLIDGGIICLDDFERKSDKIDLNDLFGFISQLAIEMNCKIVIILNSDVFTGKEAEVFRNVKEKIVNKFFYFKPSIEELFKSISDDGKYNDLEAYKEDILNAIKETEELNARVYIQVLDNCLEWLKVKEVLAENIVRVLVLGTFNFVLNHMVLDYTEIVDIKYSDNKSINYILLDSYDKDIQEMYRIHEKGRDEIIKVSKKTNELQFMNMLKSYITSTTDEQSTLSQEILLKWVNDNSTELKALWKFGYQLYYVADVDEETYNEIEKFIKSGILI